VSEWTWCEMAERCESGQTSRTSTDKMGQKIREKHDMIETCDERLTPDFSSQESV
jgi:hypothetical protein